MNRKDALEFLELADHASDLDIELRLSEKKNYFTHLCENAPNDFLKKLHGENIEKILLIRNLLGLKNPGPAQDVNKLVYQRVDIYQGQADKSSRPGQPVAWLVRHTENQSPKTYPLYLGKNVVGRSVQPGMNAILIDDDPYVSNRHAVLDILNMSPLKILLSDDQNANHGKASRNGTYINGSEDRLIKPLQIGENDTIQIGCTKLIVRVNNAALDRIVREVEETEFMKTVVINIF